MTEQPEQPRTKVEHFRSAVETVLGEVLPETAERILRAFEKALREAEEQAFAKGYAEAATRMLFDVLERERQSEDRPIPRYCEGCAKGGEHGKDHS